MMYAANLELWMFAAFSVLMKRRNDMADAVLAQIDNISAKISIVYAVAELRAGVISADEIVSTKAQTLEAMAFRNMLAHGNFGINPAGKPIVNAGITNPNRSKPKTVTLTIEKIRGHADALQRTIMTIRKHFGSDLYVFHQGTVDGKPSTSPRKPSQASQGNKLRQKDRQPQSRRTLPESPQEKE